MICDHPKRLARLSFLLGGTAICFSGASALAVNVTNVSAALSAAGYGSSFGSVGQGINDAGQVVGYYNVTGVNNGSQIPFVYLPTSGSGGTVTALTQVTQGFSTQASAVNNSGVVVGSGTVGSNLNGFVYRIATESFTSVPPSPTATPGNGTANVPTKTFFNAVNGSGIAAGYVGYDGTNTGTRAYRGSIYNTTTGVGTDVGSGFSGPTTANNSTSNQNIILAISGSGVLVGYGPNTGGVSGDTGTTFTTQKYFTATPTGTGSYTYSDFTSAISVLPVYNGVASGYMGIDSAGYIAGSYKGSGTTNRYGFLYNVNTNSAVQIDLNNSARANVSSFADVNGLPVVGGSAVIGTDGHAFVYMNGVTTDISGALAGTAFSNYLLTSVNGINAKGDVLAYGLTLGSVVPATFVLTAYVPEPASLASLAAGVFGLLARRRRC